MMRMISRLKLTLVDTGSSASSGANATARTTAPARMTHSDLSTKSIRNLLAGFWCVKAGGVSIRLGE
jgi:hypothetical protein